jgi:hypothetical protein
MPVLNPAYTRYPLDKKKSYGLFIFMISMLLVAILSARTPLDTDMWWHIRSGEVTIKTGAPLLVDTFSFTREGTAWTNHSWLAQVIVYLVYSAGGFVGLALYTTILAVTMMALMYRLLEGPPLLKMILTLLAALACAPVWTPRPQMFSLIFLIGLYSLLLAFKKYQNGRLWLIPILFALWSNLHGGFALGLILLAVFLASEAAGHILVYPQVELLPWEKIKKLALWSLSAVPAVLLNPNGIKTWLIPFQTVGVTALQNYIDEWASPNFHNINEQVILWLLFLMLISFSLTGRRISLGDFLIPGVFAYMTFLAKRNIAVFGLTAAPAISRNLQTAWNAWWEKVDPETGMGKFITLRLIPAFASANKTPRPAISRLVNLAIVGLAAAVAFGRLGYFTNAAVIQDGLEAEYPVQAVGWLKEHPDQKRIFNEYNWGGYLILASPQSQVFLDGRTDLFGDEIIGEWVQAVNGQPEWQSILDKYGVQAALLNSDRRLVPLLKEAGWKVEVADEKSVLLVKE